MRVLFTSPLVLAGLLAASAAVAAQEPVRPGERPDATRAELEAVLARMEAGPPASGEPAAAERIRARLRDGDFAVGDPILLTIEGEASTSDTLTVAAGRVLALPEVGEVSLAGVLRSELEAHLTAELGRYFREPVVRARPLILLSVAGEVERPGFYMLTDRERLSEALMLAGGPTREAAMEQVRIERADGSITQGEDVRDAIAAGHTLAHLGIRSGDRMIVPERSGITRAEVLRAFLVAVPAAVLTIIQLR